MANENPSPLDDPSGAPTPIEVLLAGNIADDDMLWVVRCTAAEFQRLVLAPVEWVAALGTLPDWIDPATSQRAPAPTLSRDFAMTVRPSDTPDALGRIVVQGISGTNALTVFASPLSAAQSAQAMGLGTGGADPLQAFWDAVASDPANPPSLKKALPISVVSAIGTFFGHFEILDPSQTLSERAARNATFMLGAAVDPMGHAAMLNGLEQQVAIVVSPAIPTPPSSDGTASGRRAATTSGASPTSIALRPVAAPAVVYATMEGTDGTDDGSTTCEAIVGPYDPATGSGDLSGTTIKRWGGGGNPQPAPTGPTGPG